VASLYLGGCQLDGRNRGSRCHVIPVPQRMYGHGVMLRVPSQTAPSLSSTGRKECVASCTAAAWPLLGSTIQISAHLQGTSIQEPPL
jgi:hypothetical protein